MGTRLIGGLPASQRRARPGGARSRRRAVRRRGSRPALRCPSPDDRSRRAAPDHRRRRWREGSAARCRACTSGQYYPPRIWGEEPASRNLAYLLTEQAPVHDHTAVRRSQMLKRVEGDRSLRDLRVVVFYDPTCSSVKTPPGPSIACVPVPPPVTTEGASPKSSSRARSSASCPATFAASELRFAKAAACWMRPAQPCSPAKRRLDAS